MQHRGDEQWAIDANIRFANRHIRLMGNPWLTKAETRCRVCSEKVTLCFPRGYSAAIEWMLRVDNFEMIHNDHVESGNWGIHWSFDEVLSRVFQEVHDTEIWPTPFWYEDDLMRARPSFLRHHHIELFPNDGLIEEDELRMDFEMVAYKGDFLVTVDRHTNNIVTWEYSQSPRKFYNPSVDRVF